LSGADINLYIIMATIPKRLLPIGIQDFPDIRERGFVYVDKTARVHELITGSGKAFFLSRPRRFGKSLLCSTFGAIFDAKRELFGEIAGRPALAINSLDWEWKRHPVIRLDLSPGNYSEGTPVLNALLENTLDNAARRYGTALRGQTVPLRLANLIIDLRERLNEKTVVIIDEYDSPLTGTLNVRDVHVELRNALKEFYGVLKSCDEHLRFVFITGVSKFSHVSIFSGMNQLNDMTFDPRYADICGLTQEEMEACFGPEIESVLEKRTGRNREEYLNELRLFYNGYRFSKAPLTVYCPFGLLKHFYSGGEFSDYWYETATPSFVVDLINNNKINILDLKDMQVVQSEFGVYDIDNMSPMPLLCQTGYLTFSDYDANSGEYTLDFPNNEVRACFAGSLLEQYAKISYTDRLDMKFIHAVVHGDLDKAMDTLSRFFAAIPYDIADNKEKYFQLVTHLIFMMLGFNCRSEVRIAAGRIDTLVITRDFVYCFEFKLDGGAEAALAQIDSKEYAFPWTGSGKKVFKVGVNFDSKKRNIGEWVSAVGEY